MTVVLNGFTDDKFQLQVIRQTKILGCLTPQPEFLGCPDTHSGCATATLTHSSILLLLHVICSFIILCIQRYIPACKYSDASVQHSNYKSYELCSPTCSRSEAIACQKKIEAWIRTSRIQTAVTYEVFKYLAKIMSDFSGVG